MRLTGFDTLASLKDSALPRVLPIMSRARASLDRLSPVRTRLADEIRKQPKLAAATAAASGTWTKLVEAFCVMIDPLISHYLPATRLVALTTASGDVDLHMILKGTATSLGPLAAMDALRRAELAKTKWADIELRLRPEQLLRRTLSLPAASRDFLAPIIEHKLERLTPWRPERVLYSYEVLPDAEPGGGVSVVLTATSKDLVTEPLQVLAEAGFVPTAVGPQQESLSEPLGLNLLRDTRTGSLSDSRLLVSRAALVILGGLTIATLVSSYWASNAIEDQRQASVRLLKARRLLKTASMGALGDQERSLLDAKQPERAMVILVDKLSQVIPDDTYLTEFALTPDKVRLAGSSGSAPALIGKLEAIGLINVRFAAAVTREKNQRDSFEITADRPASAKADAR